MIRKCVAFILVFLSLTQVEALETFEPVAVVELFTSEGCSSCPPADILLAKLVKAANEDKLHIYPLSFHVDYWNHLGWRDPYSQKEFTLRQSWYAKQLGDNTYTPQMVINGRDIMVGSDAKKVQGAINKALKEPTTVKIALQVVAIDDKRIWSTFELKGLYEGKNLSVALVEDGVYTDVGRGENVGRRLRHEHVVRQFQRLAPQSAKGSFVFAVPPKEHLDRFSIIAFIQEPDLPEILGATSVRLQEQVAQER